MINGIDWDIYTQHKIRAKSGWYYLNQQVANEAKQFNGGMYVYTDRRRWLENKYKNGETIRGEQRLFEQGADQDEDMYIIGFIPLDIKKAGYDKRIHTVLEDVFDCKIIQKESANVKTEWIEYPVSVCPVGTTTLAIQYEQKDTSAGRVELMFTLSQIKQLDKALKAYEDGKILLAELCPRFGKTVWALALFDHTDNEVMVVSSYVHSVFNSFKTDYARFTQFEHIAIANSIEQVNQNTANGLRSLVLVPLTDNFNRWKEKYGWVQQIASKFVFVDEADFGAHKPSQVKKVEYLRQNG